MKTMIGRLAGPTLILLSSVYALWLGWGKWPDVLIDFGKELYVPWQLSEGQVLYKDIAHYLGPFSFYLNSIWFRVFGVSLQTLVFCNIAVFFMQICLLYVLLADVGDRLAATVGCIVFVFVFGCPQLITTGNYNYICPHTHEAVHGTVLATAAVLLFLKSLRSESITVLGASGFTLGLSFLTRPEPFFAASVAITSGVLLTQWSRPLSWRAVKKQLGLFIGCGLFPVVTAWILLACAMPIGDATRGVVTPWLTAMNPALTGLNFNQNGLGLDAPAANLMAMAIWTGYFLLAVVPIVLLSLHFNRLTKLNAILAVLLLIAVGVCIGFLLSEDAWHALTFDAARPFPLFMMVIGGVLLVLIINQRGRQEESPAGLIAKLTVVVFAFVMLGKMVLNARVYQYGFVIAMPAALVMVTTMVTWLPGCIDHKGGRGTVLRVASVALIFVLVATTHRYSMAWYSVKTTPVGQGKDAFLADARGQLVDRVVNEINDLAEPDQTLAALPEGAMINFLTRRPNSTPSANLMPAEFAVFGKENIRKAFMEAPPDFIVLVHKDTTEFGYRFFGVDYGQYLAKWILRHYRPVFQAGAAPFTSNQFGMVLMQHHKAGQEPSGSVE